jgi:hypothetical protein
VTALVRGWKNGTYPDNGIMLRGPEHSGVDSSWRGFSTREGSFTPKLTITYISASGAGALEISADDSRARQAITPIAGTMSDGYPLDVLCDGAALRANRKCLALP